MYISGYNYPILNLYYRRFYKLGRRSVKKFLRTKRNKRKVIYATGVLTIIFLGFGLVNVHSTSVQELQSKNQTLKRLNIQLQTIQQQKSQTLEQKKQTEQDLKQQIDSLNKQLQAKAEARQKLAASLGLGTASAAGGCGDNEYAHYIYFHESGCRTSATNSIGCKGIGQSCPASKIAHCGDDYACQNAWFTQYAQRYGGWQGAYNFWVAHRWW